MSWLFVAVLACAVVVLIGAEWPRLSPKLGVVGKRSRFPRMGILSSPSSRQRRSRAKRKSNLKLLRSESDKFAESVERDLAELPTTEERERR